jgi:hypothetical protein
MRTGLGFKKKKRKRREERRDQKNLLFSPSMFMFSLNLTLLKLT